MTIIETMVAFGIALTLFVALLVLMVAVLAGAERAEREAKP